MTNKEIGFKTYTWKDTKIDNPVLIDREAIEAQKQYFIALGNMRLKPPSPPKRWTFKDYWKEALVGLV